MASITFLITAIFLPFNDELIFLEYSSTFSFDDVLKELDEYRETFHLTQISSKSQRKIETLFELVKDGVLTLHQAAEKMGMTVPNFQAATKNLDSSATWQDYISNIKIQNKNYQDTCIAFTTNNDLFLLSSEVNEKYYVYSDSVLHLLSLETGGSLKTKFYYDNVPDIPAIDTPFDYSPYLPIR